MDMVRETRLNNAVLEWESLSDSGNKARREALRLEIFGLSFSLFDDGSERFLDIFVKTLENYDSAKGEFTHYLRFTLSRRGKEKDLSELSDSIDQTDPETGKPRTEPADPNDSIVEWEKLEVFLELTAMVLHFAEHHPGRSGNETRRMWYRLFYTEDITQALKMMDIPNLYRSERDVMAAMEQAYLRYYMSSPCETLRQIAGTPLKPYCQIVEDSQDSAETPLPIPADVSLSYLRRCRGLTKGVSRTARSNQHKPYEEEKRALLC